MFIFWILLIIQSLIAIFKPELIWLLSESWKSNADEPSDFYLEVTPIIGVLTLALTILIMLFSL